MGVQMVAVCFAKVVRSFFSGGLCFGGQELHQDQCCAASQLHPRSGPRRCTALACRRVTRGQRLALEGLG